MFNRVRILEIEKGSFTPLVFSSGFSKEADKFIKHLAGKISDKKQAWQVSRILRISPALEQTIHNNRYNRRGL